MSAHPAVVPPRQRSTRRRRASSATQPRGRPKPATRVPRARAGARVPPPSPATPTAPTTPDTDMSPRVRAHDTALAALVEVELDAPALDMVGGTNTGTHYSLPGRARVTFPALPASFGGRYRLLHRLAITFEGKAEYWDADGRYTPLRLHAATEVLLDASPSNTDPAIKSAFAVPPFCPAFGATTIALPFDLRVPGWLPPTLLTRHSATSYGIVGEATVGWAAQTLSRARISPTPLVVDGRPVLARLSRSAYTPVLVRRHRLPAPIAGDEAPRRAFPFRCKTLPVDLTIKHAEYVDLGDARGVKIDMHLRANAGSGPEAEPDEPEAGPSVPAPDGDYVPQGDGDVDMADPFARLPPSPNPTPPQPVAHVVHIAMEIEEREDVRSTVAALFASSFPLPSQAPPLLGPSSAPPAVLASARLPGSVESARRRITRACLLLPNGAPQSHTFDVPRPVGALGAAPKRIKGALTFHPVGRVPGADASGPFVRVAHSLKTHVTFERGGEYFTETFKTPVRLVTCPAGTPDAVPPPYVTVFHENGDLRDCDPLPLYVPAAEDVDVVEELTARSPEPEPEAESEGESAETGSGTSSPASSSRATSAEPEPEPARRRAAGDLSPASRKLFEQWAREASAPLEGDA